MPTASMSVLSEKRIVAAAQSDASDERIDALLQKMERAMDLATLEELKDEIIRGRGMKSKQSDCRAAVINKDASKSKQRADTWRIRALKLTDEINST
jgi:molybdopterin-guanine dinucleotide biosynthesis protein